MIAHNNIFDYRLEQLLRLEQSKLEIEAAREILFELKNDFDRELGKIRACIGTIEDKSIREKAAKLLSDYDKSVEIVKRYIHKSYYSALK